MHRLCWKRSRSAQVAFHKGSQGLSSLSSFWRGIAGIRHSMVLCSSRPEMASIILHICSGTDVLWEETNLLPQEEQSGNAPSETSKSYQGDSRAPFSWCMIHLSSKYLGFLLRNHPQLRFLKPMEFIGHGARKKKGAASSTCPIKGAADSAKRGMSGNK